VNERDDGEVSDGHVSRRMAPVTRTRRRPGPVPRPHDQFGQPGRNPKRANVFCLFTPPFQVPSQSSCPVCLSVYLSRWQIITLFPESLHLSIGPENVKEHERRASHDPQEPGGVSWSSGHERSSATHAWSSSGRSDPSLCLAPCRFLSPGPPYPSRAAARVVGCCVRHRRGSVAMERTDAE
jgi:hypothetical protein